MSKDISVQLLVITGTNISLLLTIETRKKHVNVHVGGGGPTELFED